MEDKMLNTLVDIDKKVADVNKEIKRCIEQEGLTQEEIEIWINHLNHILQNVDHAVEVLLESKN